MTYKKLCIFNGGNTFLGRDHKEKIYKELHRRVRIYEANTYIGELQKLFLETKKYLNNAMITSWEKAQGFVSNLGQAITTKLRECCSVQVYVACHESPLDIHTTCMEWMSRRLHEFTVSIPVPSNMLQPENSS